MTVERRDRTGRTLSPPLSWRAIAAIALCDGVESRYYADFDAGTVTIDDAPVPIRLENVNAVLVDDARELANVSAGALF